MSNTLSQIADATYSAMKIKSDSTVFDRSSRVIPLIRGLERDVTTGSLASLLEQGKAYQSPVLSFMTRQAFYKTVKDPVLSADASSGDVTVSVDTTNLPASGALYGGGCVFTYSGKTATTVTGVSGLVRDLAAGTSVKLVFATPALYAKPFECYDLDNGEREIDFVDDRAPKTGLYYTEKAFHDGSASFLYFLKEDDNVRLSYVVRPEGLLEETSQTVLPNDYGINLLAKLAAGTLLFSEYGEDPLGLRGK